MRATHYFFHASAFVLFAAASQGSRQVCPLLGPAFPAPRDLSSNGAFRKAAAALDAALNDTLRTGASPYAPDAAYNKTAFSITLFSGASAGLLHEFHHTPPSIANSTIGTQEINADSIYRIASVSKLLTAYLLLIRDGETHLNTPIAKLIPELAKASLNFTLGVLINWNQVTVADLMTQMSGLGYNYGYDDFPPAYQKAPAYPPIPSNQVPPCNYITDNGTYVGCSREQLIQGVASTPALFQPGHTPVYSNVGYDVFGLALEAIAGAPVKEILEENLIKALNLNGTSYTVPNNTKNGVIVPWDGSIATSEWYQDFRYGSPDGGYFTSSNDLAAIGRSILSSSQIDQAMTNRWLKPRTFTSSSGTALAVGAPWEIFRAGTSEHVYYLYTKEGDLSTYHTMFVLVPDFDFGFTVLATGLDGDLSLPGANLIIDTIMLALEDIARDQAQTNLAGTYRATDLNSSVTFETDSHPGLKITEWISNGTNFLKSFAGDAYGTSLRDLDFRLFPNQLYSGDKIGFTGSVVILPNRPGRGVFSDPCQTWTGPGGDPYGKVDTGSFVFDVDASTGRAMSVRSEALRISMEKG